MATVNQLSFPTPETFGCPTCGENITLYDPDGSEFCICVACQSYIRFISQNTPKAQKKIKPVIAKPIIPLGTEGTLKEHKFKLIAYLEKEEKETAYTWKEYLLYNYEKGYATLAEFGGHWNFIVDKNWEPSLEKAYSDSTSATHQNIEYRVFNKYTPVTTALIGELDWDVLLDSPKTNEYIAPPFILTRESDSPGSKTVQYFWGEYTEPEEIANGFGLDVNSFPAKEGIGANQPSRHSVSFDTLAKYTMLAIFFMMLMHFIIKIIKPEKDLINSDYNIMFDLGPSHVDSTGSLSWGPGTYEFKPFLTPSFEQKDGNVPLEIEVGSNVDNNWMEATVILVNDRTNETWEVTKGAEYYHGYEGGERWTEGSKKASIILSEIPEGKYHLNIFPASGDPSQTFLHIRVTSNVTLWRNIFLAIFILSLYPLYCWYTMRNFEKQRWMNSDHSPYESE
ncbi:DUF4178 domain-containing protein [Pedobacter sp. P351]|uniref:DUF4178 domain-containing protein n=1 Tax=Pedobacter superstes TaxID=3133441 RepID=UPI0030A0DD9C